MTDSKAGAVGGTADPAGDHVERLAITELLVRYASAIDRRDWTLFRSCFTEDCHADYGDIAAWDSADAITGYMAQSHADFGHTLHRITNPSVTVDGDRASARSYVDAVLMKADGASGFNAIGFYDDDLVRTAEGWRIARRQFTMVRFSELS